MHLNKVPHLHHLFLHSITACVMENVSVYVRGSHTGGWDTQLLNGVTNQLPLTHSQQAAFYIYSITLYLPRPSLYSWQQKEPNLTQWFQIIISDWSHKHFSLWKNNIQTHKKSMHTGFATPSSSNNRGGHQLLTSSYSFMLRLLCLSRSFGEKGYRGRRAP